MSQVDTQSNASSTDDYVRELLDPDDRPRNVWHVVEGPKKHSDYGEGEPPEEQDNNRPASIEADDISLKNIAGDKEDNGRLVEEDPNRISPAKSVDPELSDQPNPPDDPQIDLVESNQDNRLLDKVDKGRDRGSRHVEERSRDKERREDRKDDRHHSYRDGSRRRSSSSRRHRHHGRDRGNADDLDRDKHRSRRRRDLSDDEDDGRRRHSHRERRRSRSRSRSRSKISSSRRRERSRSESQSPITKRNSRTILIMQLNPKVNSRDLEDFFSDIGRVREVRLIMDSKTRRHKGIAYIEFEEASSAAKAFALNGQKFFGAPIVIQSAQMDRNKPSGDWHSSTSQIVNHTSSHSSSRSNLPPNSYRVYVGSLNVNLTEEMIRSVFEPFGPIVRLELMRDRVTNVSRGYAFITYANIEDGQNAVQCLDGLELGGKALRVSKSTDKSERNTGSTDTKGSGASRAGHHHHDSDLDGRKSRAKDLTASLYELAGH